MAPNLAVSQHVLIRGMTLNKSLTTTRMADVTGCSEHAIRSTRSNLRCFGTVKAPFNDVGRPRSITPLMLEALREYLLEQPGLYQDEMVLFLWNEFGVGGSNSPALGDGHRDRETDTSGGYLLPRWTLAVSVMD
jgi:hypothetical protein